MALSPYKIYVAGEILTAADLNASFSQITSNALQLISPLTGTLDVDGKTIILDADADSSLAAGTDDILTLTLQAFAAFVFDGDVASPVNGISFFSSATGVAPSIVPHGSDANISLTIGAKGTGDIALNAGGAETDLLVRAIGTAPNIALRFQGKGTGQVELGDADLAWPDADGTAGEALVTNGAGVLSWSGGLASGDRLAFQQTTPGGSFVKDTGITSNSAVRLTTGAIADDLTGSAFTTVFAPARGSYNNSVGHTHSLSVSGTTDTVASGPTAAAGGAAFTVATNGHSHTVTSTGTSGGVSANHTHTTDMKVDYYDFTIGEAV